MDFNQWQAVNDPARGIYGTWERDQAACVAHGLTTTDRTRLVQTLFATACFCQVIFMGTRAPRVTWEAIYLPMVESILYSLSASGNGTLRMGDGNAFPFSRMASWLITCPIMLFMVCGIHKKMKIRGLDVRNMVMAAALIRIVCGMSASVTITPYQKWMFFSFGFACLVFEFFVVSKIFAAGIAKFSAIETTRNKIACQRIKILRIIFFVSWSAFPLIWTLSPTGLCFIGEDESAIAYLVADALCKNTNGLIQTNTLFGVLNGKWIPETLADADKPRENADAETYLHMALGAAGMRSSVKASVVPTPMPEKEGRAIQRLEARSPGKEKMKNKNPEPILASPPPVEGVRFAQADPASDSDSPAEDFKMKSAKIDCAIKMNSNSYGTEDELDSNEQWNPAIDERKKRAGSRTGVRAKDNGSRKETYSLRDAKERLREWDDESRGSLSPGPNDGGRRGRMSGGKRTESDAEDIEKGARMEYNTEDRRPRTRSREGRMRERNNGTAFSRRGGERQEREEQGEGRRRSRGVDRDGNGEEIWNRRRDSREEEREGGRPGIDGSRV